VVIPGVQGRWEWMEPGVDALAERGRVITFSLADEPSARAHFDESAGFSNYVEQAREALDQARLDRATVCGISYGGLIAAAFAARYPARVSSLVLVSALPPSWRPDDRVDFYLRHPWLMTPLFCAGSLQFYEEIAASQDTWWGGMTTAGSAARLVLLHKFHPGRMARHVHLLSSAGRIDADLRRVKVPTMLVTGEERLERVVPPRLTREYAAIWPHARVETLARTGHLGMITRSQEFAGLISRFLECPN
jgi:pimeloyl-ACP methyl ester carboxylesterase